MGRGLMFDPQCRRSDPRGARGSLVRARETGGRTARRVSDGRALKWAVQLRNVVLFRGRGCEVSHARIRGPTAMPACTCRSDDSAHSSELLHNLHVFVFPEPAEEKEKKKEPSFALQISTFQGHQ